MSKIWDKLLGRNDSWTSELTGLGQLNKDKRRSYTAQGVRFLESTELDNLFCTNYLTRRIVQKQADLELRAGYTIAEIDDPNMLKELRNQLEDLDFDNRLTEARTWERLHGGAVMVLGIDDGNRDAENPHAQPLNESTIREIRWIEVLDRWSIHIEKWSTDAKDRRGFAKPEMFTIADPNQHRSEIPRQVHASRCIWFPGDMAPARVRAQNNGWGLSVLEPCYQVCQDFGVSFEGVAMLCQEAGIANYKMAGLVDALANAKGQAIKQRLELMHLASSIIHARILDADREDFERQGVPLQGMAEVLRLLMATVSAAADMPQTVLFGTSPDGMNATGASDLENWYSSIEASQVDNVRPHIDRFLRLLFLSKMGPTRGKEPTSWRVVFNPLQVESEKEMVETRGRQADTDLKYIQGGVVSPQEIRDSRFAADGYSIETVIDTSTDVDVLRAIENQTEVQSDPEGDPDADETL